MLLLLLKGVLLLLMPLHRLLKLLLLWPAVLLLLDSSSSVSRHRRRHELLPDPALSQLVQDLGAGAVYALADLERVALGLLVFEEVAVGLEGEPAGLARERPLVGVGADVLVEDAGLGTGQAAEGTCVVVAATPVAVRITLLLLLLLPV